MPYGKETSAFQILAERIRKGPVRVGDLPLSIEPERETRAGQDPTDGVGRLDLEFVFLLSWWVSDCDQQLLAGCSGGRSRVCNLKFELGLGLRLCSGKFYSRRVWSRPHPRRELNGLTIVLDVLH